VSSKGIGGKIMIQNKNEIVSVGLGFLKELDLKAIGDNLSARITKSGRQVLKIVKNDGADKYSVTRYPSTGTVVETRTTKTKR
jgi:hypothetical protein